ncbi:MAG: EF-P beta-lysylation protein EpmB [Methylococcales bacterium]|nr:EF-P beta-lysylation protein EpmB [Methylococcales bacterium]
MSTLLNTPQNWQQHLAKAFTDITELCQFLNLDPKDLPVSQQAGQRFSLRVPRNYVTRIKKNDPKDPLLLQVLPVTQELLTDAHYTSDPVGDINALAAPGIIHKYQGRALLINTGSCAINCRYCFRKEFPYADQHLRRDAQNSALDYLQQHPTISEVILSGGDPLILNDDRLQHLFTALKKITHIKRIRIHSRIPIVLPERITPELISLLNQTDKKIIIVLHCNHSNEIDNTVKAVTKQFIQNEFTVLNQSVLLKNINDSVETLQQLSETLFDAQIQPYYLHLLDKVTGTQHFNVQKEDAVRLVKTLRNTLPGYLIPQLVQEQAGKPAKTVINLQSTRRFE